MHRVVCRLSVLAATLVFPLSSTTSCFAQQVAASEPGATTPTSLPALDLDSPSTPASIRQQRNFFQRLAAAYKEDWHPTQPAGPAPAYRGYAPPLDSPPFPGIDYSVGGTPILGSPDTQTYTLMQAINQNRSRIKVYGWFNGGFNVSTSNRGNGANSPAAYYYTPNKLIPDQEVLYIERLPNTVQTEHFDWGFRVAQLYGQDYRYTTSKGVFSQQLLQKNHKYGYDPVMYYVDLYFPHVAKGMNVRVGRYISVPDIEAQLAPNNYTYSHSLLYTVDPYTQTGIVASTKLSNHWMIQLGLSDGNDVALWTPDAQLISLGCIDILFEVDGCAGDGDCAVEAALKPAVACGESAKLFELAETAFDAVARFV